MMVNPREVEENLFMDSYFLLKLPTCAIIVVRYYGGINLGVGGLITAYKTAAKEAIEQAEIIEKEEHFEFSIRYSYNDTSDVERILNKFQIEVLKKTFHNDCLLKISANLSDRDKISAQLSNWII
jgi:putative IMPACT (imprinted ancient) family translation regulator